MARRLSPVMIVGIVAFLAGCASTVSGHGRAASHPNGSPTPPEPTSSSPSTTSSSPSGTVTLEDIPLRRGDLPSDWTGHRPSTGADTDDEKFDDELFACVGATGSTADDVDHVDGLEFTNGAADISSGVNRFATQADVDKDIALITNPKFESCMEMVFRHVLVESAPSASSVGDVNFDVTPGSADDPANLVAVASGEVAISTGGQTIKLYLDFAFISGQLIEADIDFENVGAPIDAALENQLIATVAERAAKA
jgi:hypothetical protein